jgi:gliding motility-associated-like protein
VDKVTSENSTAGRVFVLGESVPPTGIQGEFYLSTSLSPRASNTDNQFVKVFGNQLTEGNFQLHVFNRWGLMVFETTSLTNMITKGWDGRHKGEYLPTGSYPFILKATTITGEIIERKGMISIIN